MNSFLICITLVLPIALSQFDPSHCSNYYSPSNPPPGCEGSNTCYLELGLQNLVNNKTASAFILCIDLPGYDLYISYTNATDTFIQEIESVYIYAGSISMLTNYSLLCERNMVIYSQNLTNLQQVTLTGSRMYFLSQQDIIINGSAFTNESIIPTQCSCASQKKSCNWTFAYPQLFDRYDYFNISQYFQSLNYNFTPNNSATFIAQDSITLNAATIRYSVVGLFSESISLNSTTISASGLGYPSDSGPGCGYFDEVLNQLLGCMGSGGSHGGFGGNSSPQNCYLLVSRLPYDNIAFPIEPGSGGGFFLPHSRQSSSGGGVINIQGENLFFNGSFILAEGKNGIQGGGGGAGGTVSLDYNKINGNGSFISANGGNGDKMSSSGSGGRIRLWNHMWKHENQGNVNISVTVAGGLGCKFNELNISIQLSCGESGSVYTSPCRPGSSLSPPNYICQTCLPGTYQLTYGYSPCVSCTPKPNNSYWVQSGMNQSEIIFYENTCTYNCSEGYELYNGLCLKRSEKIQKQIYAANIYISLGMIGAAIVIYLLIILVRKLAQQESLLSFDDPSLNEAYRKKFFRLEELPYHEIRLYLSGQNHPFNPWRITEEAENNLYAELKSPLTRINHVIAKIIKQINKRGGYSRWQKLIVTALRYSYYPLSRIILSSMRKQKAREIFQEVDKFNKKIPEYELLGIKFHVQSQQTVGSLQILNYSKSVLDFYIQNYFPLYILLQKAPFDGYIIDFSDPFFKVFINQIVQKESTGKSIELFLKDANKFLKNSARVLSCLNHLWTLSDINSKFQAFLWQPTNKILGIDRQYKIDKKEPLFLVFSSENLNNNHFLLNQSLPAAYLPQIQCLKHKFIIRKELASEEDGNTLCMINNNFSEKALFWVFGILTTIFLLLSVATLFLNALIIGKLNGCSTEGWNSFNYGFIIYFALWPLCDFAAAFLNYKAILSKSEYVLADSISFNLFTIIKSIILFIGVLAKYTSFDQNCLSANQFIWLSMVLIGIAIFIVQIMIRASIITQNK